MAVAVPRRAALRVAVWAFHLALPLLGLWLLLAQPRLDARWQHHGGHFALVVAVAAVNVVLGARISEVSRRRADARLFLVSLVFLSSAGFLLLHALATPGILLGPGKAGFAIATPVGLLLAAGFAAVSGIELTPPRAAVLRRQALLRGGLALLLVAVITAFALLAEAMVAVSVAHNWHASWWEWHLLMAVAFAFVAYSAQVQYAREGSWSSLFHGIYLQETIERLRQEHTAALEALVTAIQQQATSDNPSRSAGWWRRSPPAST